MPEIGQPSTRPLDVLNPPQAIPANFNAGASLGFGAGLEVAKLTVKPGIGNVQLELWAPQNNTYYGNPAVKMYGSGSDFSIKAAAAGNVPNDFQMTYSASTSIGGAVSKVNFALDGDGSNATGATLGRVYVTQGGIDTTQSTLAPNVTATHDLGYTDDTVGSRRYWRNLYLSGQITMGSSNQGDIYYDNGTNGLTRLTPGTSGQFLKTNGAAANPSWASAGRLKAMKTANESVTSSVTLQDDDHLTLTVTSAKRYALEMFLKWDSNTAEPGGLRWRFSGVSDIFLMWDDIETATTRTQDYLNGDAEVTIPAGGSNNHGLHVVGQVLTSGTTFKLQWAQETSSATIATRLFTGSWLALELLN